MSQEAETKSINRPMAACLSIILVAFITCSVSVYSIIKSSDDTEPYRIQICENLIREDLIINENECGYDLTIYQYVEKMFPETSVDEAYISTAMDGFHLISSTNTPVIGPGCKRETYILRESILLDQFITFSFCNNILYAVDDYD